MTHARAGPTLVDAFLRGDAEAVLAASAPDATFHSPVTDYRGREQIAPILGALAHVLADARATRVHRHDDDTVAAFTATVADRHADGVLWVVGTPATALTLMLRPLETLLAGVKAMQEALAGRDAHRDVQR